MRLAFGPADRGSSPRRARPAAALFAAAAHLEANRRTGEAEPLSELVDQETLVREMERRRHVRLLHERGDDVPFLVPAFPDQQAQRAVRLRRFADSPPGAPPQRTGRQRAARAAAKTRGPPGRKQGASGGAQGAEAKVIG